jgi:hypothetical protein
MPRSKVPELTACPQPESNEARESKSVNFFNFFFPKRRNMCSKEFREYISEQDVAEQSLISNLS